MMSAARAFPVRWIPAYAGMTIFGFDTYLRHSRGGGNPARKSAREALIFREAVTALKIIKEAIEDPMRLLIDL